MISDPDVTVGPPNDGDLLTPTREEIVAAKNQLAVERAFTVDRISRLRRFVSGPALVHRERDEWKHYQERVRPLLEAIDAMTKQASAYLNLRGPSPITIKITIQKEKSQ